jgi:hypothetical protein
MSLANNVRFILLVATSSMSVATGTRAQTCGPPPGFVDSPHPSIAPSEQLASHTEEITVDRPLAVVLSAGSKTSLKDTIHKTSSLPGVAGDYPLSSIPFGTPGARRLVCLSDGSTVEEQVLEREEGKNSYRFRYEYGTIRVARCAPSNMVSESFATRRSMAEAHTSSGLTRLNLKTISSLATLEPWAATFFGYAFLIVNMRP